MTYLSKRGFQQGCH